MALCEALRDTHYNTHRLFFGQVTTKGTADAPTFATTQPASLANSGKSRQHEPTLWSASYPDQLETNCYPYEPGNTRTTKISVSSLIISKNKSVSNDTRLNVPKSIGQRHNVLQENVVVDASVIGCSRVLRSSSDRIYFLGQLLRRKQRAVPAATQ